MIFPPMVESEKTEYGRYLLGSRDIWEREQGHAKRKKLISQGDDGKKPFFVGTKNTPSANSGLFSNPLLSIQSFSNTPHFLNGIIVRGSAMVPHGDLNSDLNI
jgi:hypothetical protein